MDIINVQKPKREARLNVHFFALNTKKKEPPTNVSDSVFLFEFNCIPNYEFGRCVF